MLTIEIQNGHAFIAGLDKASVEVKAGVTEGIEKSVAQLASRVAADTPSKSGRARAAVYGKLNNPLEGEVGYAKEVRWYMRIVELSGSRPHVIIAKGLKGKLSGVTRGQLYSALRASRSSTGHYGESRSFSRNVHTFSANKSRGSRTSSKQRLFDSLKAAGVDAGRLHDLRVGLKIGARALAFESKGSLFLRVAVLHPGIKSHMVLAADLRSAQASIAANIQAGIRAQLGQKS